MGGRTGGEETAEMKTTGIVGLAAVGCESCDILRRNLEDEQQKVRNLEEYMLKGVAFRDELQARIKELEGAVEWVRQNQHRYGSTNFSSAGPNKIFLDDFETELRRRSGGGK